MAFAFGGIKETTKPKNISAVSDRIDYVIEDHIIDDGRPYFIYLVDAKPTILQEAALKKEIQRCTNNYVILIAVNTIWHKDDLKGQGITKFFIDQASKWKSWINHNGQHCAGIMAFGSSIYGINHCADILTDDFLADQFVYPYYYLGHEVWKCDSYIFPVHSINELYPSVEEGSNVNYKTRFFYKQNERLTDINWRPYKPDLTDKVYHLVETKEEADKIFKDNMNAFLCAWDTETSGFSFFRDHLHCLTICWNGVDGYYMPWEIVDKQLFHDNVMSAEHNTGANVKFDIKFMWENGVPHTLLPTDDTQLLAHAIHSDRSKGLKPQTFYFTPFGGYEEPLIAWKERTKCDDYSRIPTELLSKYATMDAIATWRVQQELWKLCDKVDREHPNSKMPEWTIKRWYEEQMLTIYKDVIDAEYRGIFVNKALMDEHRNHMLEEAEGMKKKLCEIWNVPEDFPFASTEECGKLFERLGWPCHGRNAKGFYTTEGDAIDAWKREKMPGIDIFDEWRSETASCRNFLGVKEETTIEDFKKLAKAKGSKKQKSEWTGWPQFCKDHPEDGSYRIHQSYLVMGTTSFRFIGRDPNMQNVPTNGRFAPFIKQCIDTPPSDLVVVTSDSGTEYRLASFELIKTQRGWVRAGELKETDTIIEKEGEPTVKRYELTKDGDRYIHTDRNMFIKPLEEINMPTRRIIVG